jgi:DNA-binding winged helix-turn-helix (wHTH) protein
MNAPQRTFSLGDFTFDAGEKSLWRDGVAVPVPPKSGELLAYFVAHAGRLLTKEELLEQVWAGAFVEESNLTHHIAVLRKALGEGETKYIATVPRKGYRFVAPVSLAEELQITLTEKTVTRAVRRDVEPQIARANAGRSQFNRLVGAVGDGETQVDGLAQRVAVFVRAEG